MLVLGALGGCGGTKKEQLRAAMTTVDITPDKSVFLEGYGGREESCYANMPEDFTSDIRARILALEKDGKRTVFINTETVISAVGIDGAQSSFSMFFLNNVAKEAELEVEDVILCNTHNHQAMRTMSRTQEKTIIEGVKRAFESLTPVSVGVGVISTQYGVSRSPWYTINKRTPYDALMTVVRFDESGSGRPMGMIYSVPIHNTMYGNGPGNIEHWDQLNCEFTGYASRYIEQQMAGENPEFVAMHINGFYGNSGPIYNDEYYVRSLEELQAAGESFGEEVMSCYSGVETVEHRGELQSKMLTDSLETNVADRRFEQYFGNNDKLPLYITLSSFGDIVFVGVNYEAFSITGAHLKAEAPYRHVLPAGGVRLWSGYIPTRETFENAENEAECQPYKTAFDAQTEEIFYEKLINGLCGFKGVRINRLRGERSEPSGEGVYSFDYGGTIKPDKLVVSFGQRYRTDCASDFTVRLFDENGKERYSQSFTGNSVNYLGIFLDGIAFSSAQVTVQSAYMGETDISALPVDVYGVEFVAEK